jgi:acetyltransferase EpsM
MDERPAARQPIVILGTSLFVPEVTDLAEETGLFDVRAFIENQDRRKTAQPMLNRPVVWIDDAAPMAPAHHAVCGLGTTRRDGFIAQAAALGFRFARIVHPSARVSGTSTVGDGSIVSVGAIVAAHTTIGHHVILNRGVMVGHHTTIHDYATVAPGANVAGAVTIGAGVYIGIGAVVIDRITIGEHSVIGAGSVVMRDVPDRVEVLGNPARIVKRGIEGR